MTTYDENVVAIKATVYPNGVQAITGQTLQQTLLTMLYYSFYNGSARFVNWEGSIKNTRLSIPKSDRKVGLIITYNIGNDITGRRVVEQFALPSSINGNTEDYYWQDSAFWNQVTELPDFKQKSFVYGWKFPNITSYIRAETPMLNSDKNGAYNIIFDVPKTKPFENQMLFSFDQDIMVTLIDHWLRLYYNGSQFSFIDLTPYLGKQVYARITKRENVVNVSINGILIGGMTLPTVMTVENNVVYIGSYQGTALNFSQTIYHFSVEYDNGDIFAIDYWNQNGTFNELKKMLFGLEVDKQQSTLINAIPAQMYCATGIECNIWYDNIVPEYFKKDVQIETNGGGNSIRNMNRCLRYKRQTTGADYLPLSAFTTNADFIETKAFTMNNVEIEAGSGTKQILFVGDSTIDNPLVIDGVPYYGYFEPAIVQKTFDVFNANKGFTPLYIGHKKQYPPYFHAGMSGLSSYDFLNSNSPFWYNGKNDFKHYVQTVIADISGAVDRVDFLVYQIGINDLKQNQTQPESVIANIKTFVTQFLADYPSAKVIIGFPASGCDTTGYSTHFFGNSSYILFRTKMLQLWQLIIDNFDNGTFNTNTYICNGGQWIDRKFGFPFKMEKPFDLSMAEEFTHWDSVHPNQEGYFEMAKAYIGRIKSLV